MQNVNINPIHVPIRIDFRGKTLRYIKKMEHLGKKSTAPTIVVPANMIYNLLFSYIHLIYSSPKMGWVL